jgi:hypothetical protein
MARLAGAARPWIVSRRDDLVWFHGSMAAGLGLLAFFSLAPRFDEAVSPPGHPAVLALFLWGALFDGTHVWGTYARSYFAPDPASRERLPGLWSWGLLAVGPAVAVVDGASRTPGRLFPLFVLAAYLWAYWHLVRQHYGFLVLYRKRAGETDPRGARLDSVLLWAGCLYPYLRFSLGESYVRSGLPRVVPTSLVPAARLALDIAFGLTMAAVVTVVLSGRVERFRLGPKHLLLFVVIAFHLAVFGLLAHPLAILATLTIFHNLQYHRIVWQYERGLGRRPSGGLVPYVAAGLVLGTLWYGERVLGAAAVHPGLARNLLVGLGWGVAFHHYLVDGRIWRVRQSGAVSRALDAGAAAR